jgi:hypothetical protein
MERCRPRSYADAVADRAPRDPIDSFWNHLRTTATPEERAAWEELLQEGWREELPLWRRLPGMRPKPPRLPPREAGDVASVTDPQSDSLPRSGFPLEGFFAADDEEIDQSLANDGPGPSFCGVEVKTVTPVDVAKLGEIVGAGRYDDLVEALSHSMDEHVGEGGECGLYRVPRAIRDCLADADVDNVSARWGATDEPERWAPNEVRQTVAELRELAARACAEDRQLWIWWSL